MLSRLLLTKVKTASLALGEIPSGPRKGPVPEKVLRGLLNSNCSEVSGRHADGRRPHAVHMMGDGAMKSGSSKCMLS